MNHPFEQLFQDSWQYIAGETGLEGGSLTPDLSAHASTLLVSIGITGEYEGYLAIEGKDEEILPVMERMLDHYGMPVSPETRDETCLEAFKELANQISGRMIMNLHTRKVDCDITPPTTIRGGSVSLDLSSFPHQERLLAAFPEGRIHAQLGVKKHE